MRIKPVAALIYPYIPSNLMPSRYETSASFVCPECKLFVSTNIAVPELSFTGERTSETTSEGPVEVGCPSCKETFSGYCYNSMGDCDITLDDHRDTEIQAELAHYTDDDWTSYDTPDDPMAIFLDSYHHTGDLLTEHGGEGAHLVNRMIFAQQIGALETYLADTLVNVVTEDEAAMKRLIASDVELRAKKFSLAEIGASKDFVEKEVLVYLRSIVYHNLPKVRALYKIAINVDLFELLGASKDKLFKAIEYRHDCVHRNGYDSEGNRLEIFTKPYVQETADIMNALVMEIEKKIYPYTLDPLGSDFPF
jgi:hypothetical protein